MPHNPKKNGFRYTISQAGPQIISKLATAEICICISANMYGRGGGGRRGRGRGVGNEKRAAQVERIAERT